MVAFLLPIQKGRGHRLLCRGLEAAFGVSLAGTTACVLAGILHTLAGPAALALFVRAALWQCVKARPASCQTTARRNLTGRRLAQHPRGHS